MSRQLYADLPTDLQDADEILRRYGRWAMDRFRPQRCASAEGAYRPPQNDDDRQPREVLMATADVDRARNALRGMLTVNRTVVLWLYVPDGESLYAKMRRCGVPPRVMRERHLAGVREFWNAWQRLLPVCEKPVAFDSCLV